MDPNDFSDRFNTPLPPGKQRAFAEWLASQDMGPRPLYDYDMQGAFLAGLGKAGNGHFPDTFKKPNHPTFSNQSRYSDDVRQGGEWSETPDGHWIFTASPTNMHFYSPQELQRYFAEVEPESTLILAPVPAQRGTP